jgi:hypothetical protein
MAVPVATQTATAAMMRASLRMVLYVLPGRGYQRVLDTVFGRDLGAQDELDAFAGLVDGGVGQALV